MKKYFLKNQDIFFSAGQKNWAGGEA